MVRTWWECLFCQTEDFVFATGTKRFDSEKAGDREVQRTMLELLNQLDGFQPNSKIKVSSGWFSTVVYHSLKMRVCFAFFSARGSIQVIAATNRVDILDPALLRSGRLDRKIEFPIPTEEARARIMQIHSRKMNVR